MKHKSLPLASLILAAILQLTSCSHKDEVAPLPGAKSITSNINSGSPNYLAGYQVGKDDVKNLFESLTYIGNCGSDPGTQFPPNGGIGGTYTGGPLPENPGDTQLEKPSEGCRYWTIPDGPTQFDYNIDSWKTSALDHVAATSDPDQKDYYQGYYQGLVDGRMQTRF